MIDLKAAYGDIYRITLDESANVARQTRADRLWLLRIPAKYGHIYIHGTDKLGAYAAGRLIAGRLAALPEVRVHQRGDTEVSVIFPPEALPAVAALLRARKRRRVSEDLARAGSERLSGFRRLAQAGR